MARARGVLAGAGVVVRDEGEASRLVERGSYGERGEDGLVLGLHEAAYLVEEDRLRVVDEEGGEVSSGALVGLGVEAVEGFEARFLVYREYRSRGFVVTWEEDSGAFAGYARGASPKRQGASVLLCPRGGDERASPRELLSRCARARGLGRGLVFGVVDEESDVTYYEAGLASVSGSVGDPAGDVAGKVRGRLLRDRAVLEAPGGVLEGGYGHEVGGEVFVSLAEAWHLATRGGVFVDEAGARVDPEGIVERARGGRAVFGAYAWLRERGLVPKAGFKYGVDYRVYREPVGEGHAPFLVWACAPDEALSFRELARLVRLAHSVKKRAIVWSSVGALMVDWTRP